MSAIKSKGLTLSIILILIIIAIFCYPSFSKEKEVASTQWNHLHFSAEGGAHHFFDTSSGKIYEYSSSSGKLRHIWKLEELGKNYIELK